MKSGEVYRVEERYRAVIPRNEDNDQVIDIVINNEEIQIITDEGERGMITIGRMGVNEFFGVIRLVIQEWYSRPLKISEVTE